MLKRASIVRRIDDLGRIVIPKEIRRTMRIRESDPLKIFTGHEGEIILKKYSPIGEMSTFARQYAESLAQVSGHVAMIADRDQFIAVSQDFPEEFVHQAICPIICEGDVIGAVILVDNDAKGKMGEVEQKLIQSAAGFLGRQMEQ